MSREVTQSDLDCIGSQLQRQPRDVHAIAYRCPCGNPAVVETPPRLGDGTPFPTFYYATCPKLTGAISTLENGGLMADMNERLKNDPELAGAYAAAHEDYLAARAALRRRGHRARGRGRRRGSGRSGSGSACRAPSWRPSTCRAGPSGSSRKTWRGRSVTT